MIYENAKSFLGKNSLHVSNVKILSKKITLDFTKKYKSLEYIMIKLTISNTSAQVWIFSGKK